MLESYRVSALFELQDLVTEKLARIAKAVDRLSIQMDALNEKFQTFGKGIRIAGLTTRLSAMNKELDRTVERATAAGYALDGMRLPGGGIPGGGGGGRMPPGRHVRGGSGHESIHGYVPVGPLHARIAGGAGLVGGAALGYGLYENARLDDVVTRILLTANVPLGKGLSSNAQAAQLEKIIKTQSLKTGATIGEVGDAALNVVRLMAGFPLKQRSQVLPEVLGFSVLENRLKPSVSIEEAANSMVELLHQTGVYKPAEVQKLARTMMAASLVTPLTMQQLAKASGYAVPILRAGMGIGSDQIIPLLAMMQRAGITNTKSGTWGRSFFEGLVPGTLGSGLFKTGKQTRALEALGLLRGGRLTDLDKNGSLDVMKAIDTMREHLEKIPKVLRIKSLEQAFGKRGASFASLLLTDQFQKQEPEVKSFMANVASEHSMLKELYGGSEIQQARIARQGLTVATMQLTAALMGPLSGSLKKLNTGLAAVIQIEQKHPKAAGYIGTGAAALLGAALGKRLITFLAPHTSARIGGLLGKLAPIAPELAAVAAAIFGVEQAIQAIWTGHSQIADWTNEGLGKMFGVKNFSLGGQLYDFLHPGKAHGLNIPEVHAAGGMPNISVPKETHVHVHIDGRKVAHAVARHANDHAGVVSGTTFPDSLSDLLPPNLSTAY